MAVKTHYTQLYKPICNLVYELYYLSTLSRTSQVLAISLIFFCSFKHFI